MSKSIHRKELIVIYRQEILKDIRLFTSQPVAKFYDSLFLNLDLSFIPEFPKTGRKGFSNHAMICAFIVMKCEGFSMVTDLVDYLNNNLLIAHYCGFDISTPLPSYWTFDRFLKQIGNDVLSSIMKSQVLYLSKQGIIDTSFIGLDSTPIAANTSQNNPKSFLTNKFKPDNQPKADADCKLGVILLLIRPMRRNMSSIGVTKIMSLWTAFPVFPFMNLQPLQPLLIPLSLWIFFLIHILFYL